MSMFHLQLSYRQIVFFARADSVRAGNRTVNLTIVVHSCETFGVWKFRGWVTAYDFPTPCRNLLHSYSKWPFIVHFSQQKMMIFHTYVSLPECIFPMHEHWECS